MRILVISDSHRREYELFKVIKAEPSAEVVYFLGDGANEFENAKFEFGYEKMLIGVGGNCDFSTSLPTSDTRMICGKKIYATHGYLEKVKFGLDNLIYKAEEGNFDIILFGHTHTPLNFYREGKYFFNPGAISDGKYGVIDITDKSEIMCIHKRL